VTHASTHVWYDVVWPAVTGLLTAVGLLAAYRWMGPTSFLVAVAVLELTVAPLAWSLLTEIGYDVRRVALRVAPVTALAALAVVGLADVAGRWTFLVIGLVLLGSPLLQGWRERGVRGALAERMSPGAETRRRFDEIVAHAFGSPDEDLPPR
jgi:hypothetical protein